MPISGEHKTVHARSGRHRACRRAGHPALPPRSGIRIATRAWVWNSPLRFARPPGARWKIRPATCDCVVILTSGGFLSDAFRIVSSSSFGKIRLSFLLRSMPPATTGTGVNDYESMWLLIRDVRTPQSRSFHRQKKRPPFRGKANINSGQHRRTGRILLGYETIGRRRIGDVARSI